MRISDNLRIFTGNANPELARSIAQVLDVRLGCVDVTKFSDGEICVKINESARGLMALSMDGIAIGNGILTVEDEAQALARADRNQKDKGGEAAKAAIAMFEIGQKFSG